MAITDYQVGLAYSELNSQFHGARKDYFGLLYLENVLRIPREEAVNRIAFGGNDCGISGFHLDPERRNFYIFQFQYSDSYGAFRDSMESLAGRGMNLVFGTPPPERHIAALEAAFEVNRDDASCDAFLKLLKRCLSEDRDLVKRVYVLFVFQGSVQEANRSQILTKLLEDLENKKKLVDDYFGREVELIFEFRSAKSIERDGPAPVPKTHHYKIQFENLLVRPTPTDERMHLGFVHLSDLITMFKEMGPRFLERNIRSALPEDVAVNKALSRAFKDIILEGKLHPSVFAFNHNGITLAAESLEADDGRYMITEPRLLNGAQTIATLFRFIENNGDLLKTQPARERYRDLQTLCKIVTGGSQDFITTVTINNNRQNPIEPWNLRANDMIQLALQDKFWDERRVVYERQENAYALYSEEELAENGWTGGRPLEIRRLAQTFLAIEGEVDKISRLKEVFEDDRIYNLTFSESRLKADCRKIFICYKAQFRLRMAQNAIAEKGSSKYEFIARARNLLWALLCQGMLNDPKLEEYLDAFGQVLTVEAGFSEWLARVAANRCRFLISDVVSSDPFKEKAAEGNWGFLRSNQAYRRAMESAAERYAWVRQGLKI